MTDAAALVRTSGNGVSLQPELSPPRTVGPWRVVVRRFVGNRLALVSLVVLIGIVVVAVVGGRTWRYDYADITDDLSMPPSPAHPMGTDGLGRDLFAQVLRGTRRSLQVALVVAALSTGFGAVLGAVAGYRRGWFDMVFMRLTDVALTVPGIAVLAVLAGSAQRSSGRWLEIALIIALLSWMGIARVVRAMMLSLRERDFVQAAEAVGATPWRILFRHLLPHVSGPIIVRGSLAVGGAILAESALSYLGIGLRAPDTSLGLLVDTGQHSAETRPWLFYFPGLVILVIVLAVNFIGEGLRDALDPTAGSRRSHASIARWPMARRP